MAQYEAQVTRRLAAESAVVELETLVRTLPPLASQRNRSVKVPVSQLRHIATRLDSVSASAYAVAGPVSDERYL